MHKFFLCLRYLRKRRIAFFGVAAVALCVALLIVVTSLFSGFIDAYLSHAQRVLGEIVLVPGAEMARYDELVQCLEEQPAVASAIPVVQTGALLFLGKGDVRAVQLVGTDLERRCREPWFRKSLFLQGGDEAASPSFAVPQAMREKVQRWMQAKRQQQEPVGVILGVGVFGEPDDLTDEYDRAGIEQKIIEHDSAMVLTTVRRGRDGGGLETAKISKPCWAVDVIQTGMNDVDTRFVYLPFEVAQEMIGTKTADADYLCRGSVQIRATEGVKLTEALEQVRAGWDKFATERMNWSQGQAAFVDIFPATEGPGVKIFTHEIRKQMNVMQLLLGLICLVAALLIFVILFMVVIQKRRDIGIVRSLGSSRWAVAELFLWYGGGIGVLGAILGVALGAWATWNIAFIETLLTQLLGFKIWKSGVYMFSEIPHEVAWNSVGWIVPLGIASAVVGALIPAIKAARMEPVEALRWE
ncbi:MAG: ABC transporter permease [Sedimentisphaerales bacterium]|nr:ABC transporter permease [Sedimentisphaerales bacterium]